MGCKARSIRAERVGAKRVPDVEPAGAVKFRIVGETNGTRMRRATGSGQWPGGLPPFHCPLPFYPVTPAS
ncbi:hypothetical protein GCM10008959_07910 [Deinococcus seoulensis]|uniref:Uncharacterized protein n=1 Tax=Deinococcus seoulensis TaxID=1837379 RepID=A0ABQ2RM90_9DEIO|nr:hypothetical protein GCM10008959_07910 [Deinococcus seoulensis]